MLAEPSAEAAKKLTTETPYNFTGPFVYADLPCTILRCQCADQSHESIVDLKESAFWVSPAANMHAC